MRERIFGVREYRIVELKNGSVIAINNSLAPGDVRRLMYALDLKAGKPVEIRMEAKGGSIFFTLRVSCRVQSSGFWGRWANLKCQKALIIRDIGSSRNAMTASFNEKFEDSE